MTTITVQVFARYTVHDDGSVTAEVDLGDPDLSFIVDEDDFGDAEHEVVATIERVLGAKDEGLTRLAASAPGVVRMKFRRAG
jgi:hypothetical protein